MTDHSSVPDDPMASSGESQATNADTATLLTVPSAAITPGSGSEFRIGLATHASVFCVAFGGFTNLYATQAIYPTLQDRFAITVSDAGSLLTATTLGLALTAPFAGRVANRFGPKKAALGGLALLILSVMLISQANTQIHLVALRLLQGMLIPVVLSALLASIGSMSAEEGGLSLPATYVTGTVLGGLAGRFIPALALAQLDWGAAFVAFGAAQALLLAVAWHLYPKIPFEPKALPSLASWTRALYPMFRARLLGVAIGGFCLLFAQTAVTTYIAIRLASAPYDWQTPALGALYVAFLPALIFVRQTPRAIERLGSSRTLGFAAGCGWIGLLLTLNSAVVVIVVGLVLFSAAVFVGQTVLAHDVGLATADNKEMASGLYLCAYYLGGSAGALTPALIWASTGWGGCLALIAVVHTVGYAIVRKRAP